MKKILFILVYLMTLTIQAQKIAVLEFEAAQGISISEVDGISSMFQTYFHPAGYTLVDRNRVKQILDEQGFQHSKATQEVKAKLGEVLNVSKVVVGTVSMLGGKYQVDVRVDDVERSDYCVTEGATFTGDFRTHVRDLATRMAEKIAINPGRTTQGPFQSNTSPQSRSTVETLYGYLKIFPNELGVFDEEPTSVISQINKQAQHGYNNWRIPTNEELSLMKANNYLGSGEYMTRENRHGIVLLVTDDDNIKTKEKELEQTRLKAEQGSAEAQCSLGVCYANGTSVTQDWAEAVRWFKKAAEQGSAIAQENLGVCYANGYGVSQSWSDAVYWYRKAAEQGSATAQYNLGVCYYIGSGISKSLTDAFYWCMVAAKQGLVEAQLFLGTFFETGMGGSINKSAAIYWYKKAADQGDDSARAALDRLK